MVWLVRSPCLSHPLDRIHDHQLVVVFTTKQLVRLAARSAKRLTRRATKDAPSAAVSRRGSRSSGESLTRRAAARHGRDRELIWSDLKPLCDASWMVRGAGRPN